MPFRGIFLFGAGLLVGYFVARRREAPARDPADPAGPATKPAASSGSAAEPADPAGPATTEPVQAEPQAAKVADGRCAYVTRRGTRCTRKVLGGTDRCWQHSPE